MWASRRLALERRPSHHHLYLERTGRGIPECRDNNRYRMTRPLAERQNGERRSLHRRVGEASRYDSIIEKAGDLGIRGTDLLRA